MNINDISTQLLYTTIPIWGIKADNSQVSGTGFIFDYNLNVNGIKQSIPLLITNYHVLDGVVKGIFEFAVQRNGQPAKGERVRVEFNQNFIGVNKLGNLDLVAIPLASTVNELSNTGKSIFFKSINLDIIPNENQIDDFAAIEDITFIGYPSGLYDDYNVSSIIRRGITATPIWNDFKGESAFLIDAGVFPGSSGSPVFILNQGSYPSKKGITIGSRLFFIGVLTESIVRKDNTFLGLGKVINSSVIRDELEKHIMKLTQNANI